MKDEIFVYTPMSESANFGVLCRIKFFSVTKIITKLRGFVCLTYIPVRTILNLGFVTKAQKIYHQSRKKASANFVFLRSEIFCDNLHTKLYIYVIPVKALLLHIGDSSNLL